ncbi:valine--tRNA ligase [Fulvivirgaceae bacterium PWU4]|uniref:Valine--tRNA ligase n=1 Tax=Chryseosolibacter histidini TaxID=2782349 RepID=A0AAP2DQV9_9BACT|nr:valine--tRNA ligase [Chryseosolibacter histidini]MBT1700833.1 valine--tRNA ligase [Chryseosolibacter histidini]
MSLSTKYNPSAVEDKWYSYWLSQRFFHSEPDPQKEPFCIVIPPPNVTGVLHMGHMLNNTIQDVLVRRARMQGKEACWVPGTDHASIATEAKVVAMLRERGIKKSDLTREEFLKYAWEWKEKYGGIILEQLKKLGASCDWDRTKFTMDPDYYEAVIDVFIDLYNKGNIYRGLRMVNWDPAGKTALSDDEVIHRDVQSKLYYIKYRIEGSNDFITIATVRPETIMADAAICVNPKDERYKHLKGKKVLIPLIDRAIPVIEDDYVAMDFGTGCLKVTPAHDMNDYELGRKHNLEVIDILNDDGTLNEKAKIFIGEDRFIARKKIAKELEAKGNLAKVEDYNSNVGFSERTDAVIEPRLSLQWWVKMDAITRPAHKAVMDDTVQLIPAKFKNTYNHWMSNVRDWCISRQLWWGHQIPAWYAPDGKFAVAKTREEAYQKLKADHASLKAEDLVQDPDVMDTWFSSWLWPIAVFDTTIFKDSKNNKGNKDLNYYYPTNDLVTAPEILFFWVARMIIAGYEYRGVQPFKNVYLTGIVRDKLGRKMSKSLGNSPDPLDLISQHGADAVRAGMLFSAPAGNDLLYDEKLIEQGRNFTNKIWNAFRLVKGWTVDGNQPEVNKVAITWFESRLQQSLTELEDHFGKFRISDALHTLYKLIWDDFCAWYLEMVKPEFEKPIDKITYDKTIGFFETLMKALHPFMPFITEELWHELQQRKEKDCILIASYPVSGSFDQKILDEASLSFEVVTEIRNTRNNKGISPKEALKLVVKNGEQVPLKSFWPVIQKLSNLTEISFAAQAPATNATPFLVRSIEFFIPFEGKVDVAKEREAILKDIEYQKGFLASVDKKLSNEKFVSGAKPEVVEGERKKKADAEAKIKALEESLSRL